MDASTQDCTPGCTPIFQSVYSASKFGSSPIGIDSISFYLSNPYGIPATDTYTFTLSTSRNAVGSLSTVFSNNVGADAQTFWTGTLSATAEGGWVTFSGTSFLYDPTAGDLLLEIDHAADPNSEYYADDYIRSSYSYDNTLSQRAYRYGGDWADAAGYAIDTRFGVSGASGAVPEPASWALMLGGFGLVGGALRSRRRAQTSFA